MTWVKYQNCYNLRLEHSANWKYLGFYIRDLSIGKYRIRLYCKSESQSFYILRRAKSGNWKKNRSFYLVHLVKNGFCF